MKVLHAAETIQGGIATVLKQLAIWQSNDSRYSSVQCIIPDSQTEQLNPLPDQHKLLFRRSGRNISSLYAFTKILIKSVIKERPDILHLHSSFAGILGRFVILVLYPWCRPKVIYCPHAFSFLMSNKGRINRYCYTLIEKVCLIMTDKIICVSEYERDKAIESGLNADKLVTIYNGVPEKRSNLGIEENPLPKDKINIVYVGRFDYQKGYDILVNSMKELKDKRFHLTSIGSGVLGNFNFSEQDNISYTGWLPSELTEIHLSFADLLIIPSRWEGFAMVPLEAMSLGVPIIASNTTSFPEVIDDKYTGLLFDINDPKSLIKLIESYDPVSFNVMGKRGHDKFMRNFTSDKMISKTHSLYEFLM